MQFTKVPDRPWQPQFNHPKSNGRIRMAMTVCLEVVA
jgi:hypothetical protein